MRDELLLDLSGYLLLKDKIKDNKNFIKEVKLSIDRSELIKRVVPMIDNSVLSFRELYRLLKIFEERRGRQIQFQTHRTIWKEETFEDDISIDFIVIKRVGYYFQKESKCIPVNSLYADKIQLNESASKAICPDKVENADVSLFLSEFKYFKNDYNCFINLLISYLIKKYL